MRPPAVEKLGFYPTSIKVIEALKTWFAPANDGRLLTHAPAKVRRQGRWQRP